MAEEMRDVMSEELIGDISERKKKRSRKITDHDG
jgi:hypothetical protein